MKSAMFALSIMVGLSPIVALAQDQAPPGSQERRAAFMQACGQDVQTYCASARNRDERRACIHANHAKFSDGCQSFLASHFGHGAQQGESKTNP